MVSERYFKLLSQPWLSEFFFFSFLILNNVYSMYRFVIYEIRHRKRVGRRWRQERAQMTADASFGIYVNFFSFFCIFYIYQLVVTTDKGPNNVRHNVWDLGECFFSCILVLINILLYIIYDVCNKERWWWQIWAQKMPDTTFETGEFFFLIFCLFWY